MPSFDSEGVGHLDSGELTKPIFFIYLDVDGDPIRGCTSKYAVELPELDDPDLSEQTFYPTAQILTVGDVAYQELGSETLRVEMSGLLLPDNDLLNAIGDRSKWQGRVARLWVLLRDSVNAEQGQVCSYYTGYMSSVSIEASAERQAIRLEIESYLASLNQASNRSYLDQKEFDSGDTSAGATIGSANGARTGPASGVGYGTTTPVNPTRNPRFNPYDPRT